MLQENFSERNLLKSMAVDQKCDIWTVRQEFVHDPSYAYQKHKVPIGIDEYGKTVTINLNESNHICVLGGTGSGKTFLTRGMLNRFHNAGGAVAVVTDIKPEYYTSSKPVQARFQKFLLKHEKPRGFPVKNFRPYFLANLTGMKSVGDTMCQFRLQDINLFDFMTLLNIDDMSSSQRALIEATFEEVKGGNVTSVTELVELIDQDQDAHPLTRKNLCRSINNLQKLGVLGDQFSGMGFPEEMKKGNIPVLNVTGFEKTGEYNAYASAYVGLVTRQILTAKKEGLLPKKLKMMLLYDEINKFVPKDGTNTAKEEILKAYDLIRSEGGSLVASSQDYTRIPPTIIEQSNIILMSYKCGPETLKYVIKQKAPQLVEDPFSFTRTVSDILGRMQRYKDGSRDWFYVNIDDKSWDYRIFRPLAPLSHHKMPGE